MDDITLQSARLTEKQKRSNDKQWFKEKLDDFIDEGEIHDMSTFGEVSDRKRMQVNYDLYNNIIDFEEFKYVTQPYGAEVGELPAKMDNRDICSANIKVMEGMEMKMPFNYKVYAVNEEATNRKEKEEFNRMKDFVISQIEAPIRQQAAEQAKQQSAGRELTPQEQEQIQAQIEEQVQAMKPDEVRRYMARHHQDPVEVRARHLVNFVTKKNDAGKLFQKGWKDACLTAYEIYWVGDINGHVKMKKINPKHFTCENSSDDKLVNKRGWAGATYYMNLGDVQEHFNLKSDEIDELMIKHNEGSLNDDWSFDDTSGDAGLIPVYHKEWTALQKIGFLTYLDEQEEEQLMVVSEEYKLNKEQGDIAIEWKWIPRLYEGWRVGMDIYPENHMRMVPGRPISLNDPYDCPLRYVGGFYDATNSYPTAPMDRMKTYQYLYDIIFYRIERLMASDKGKILMMNIGAIPTSAGIDTTKFMHFIESNNIGFYNPDEEGNKINDVNHMAKQIDMSLAQSIMQYIKLAEYVEERCGRSIGISEQMRAQISPSEQVGNVKASIAQSTYILYPYFERHNEIKGEVIKQILRCANYTYSGENSQKLTYVMDDLSLHMLNTGEFMDEEAEYGIFISSTMGDYETKELVNQLAHAGMQAAQVDLLDISKIMRADNMQEAEELMEAAREKAKQSEAEMEKMKDQIADNQHKRLQQAEVEKHEREKELIVLKETERRETEIQKQAMFSLGFDENKDRDDDGVPDVLEVAKHNVDADIKARKQNLDEKKFEEDKKNNEHKRKIDKASVAAKKVKA